VAARSSPPKQGFQDLFAQATAEAPATVFIDEQDGEARPRLQDRYERRVAAYHEAGHALVAWLTPTAEFVSEEMQMPEQSVVGVYDTMAQAEGALRKLDEAGFPITHVSIVSQNPQSEKEVVGYITVADVAQKGLITGAWAGGLLSLLAGAAFLWIPGFGPLVVAGRLASLLLGVLSGMEGAVIGAAYGGVLGTLAGWGVSKEHIFKYEEHVRAGKHLVIAHGNAEEVARARSLLQDTSATALHVHEEAAA
jgi:hypothetical protein